MKTKTSLLEKKREEKKEELYEPYYGVYPNCDCPFCNPEALKSKLNK